MQKQGSWSQFPLAGLAYVVMGFVVGRSHSSAFNCCVCHRAQVCCRSEESGVLVGRWVVGHILMCAAGFNYEDI